MSTSFATFINNHCDTAMAAIQQDLNSIKSIVAEHQADQMAQLSVVADLRVEKAQLEKMIAELKDALHSLENDIAATEERHQEVLTHIYTTTTPSGATAAATSDNNDEDDTSEAAEVSHEDESFDVIADDSQETFFDTRAMETQPVDEVAETSITAPFTQQQEDTAPEEEEAMVESQPVDETQPVVDEVAEDRITAPPVSPQEDFTALEGEEDDMMVVETQPPGEEQAEESSTNTQESQQQETASEEEDDGALFETKDASFSMDSNTRVSTTGSTGQRRRVSKAYKSPKKWRRMMRSHRLKSIPLIN
mmetsp:Transcript_12464/g.20691  ORF Transcript_12464/g.20691 Transcript_12464/m.20691 type:complete len:307 (-) Transcript_12464:95-1015(-)|eukprot:CAMPEP_0119013834 /NCGR_PEP_ID=MMETSP1176-20130426/9070_1 /TAXON_ID=265551 /ORGANISM="Synedropsis recta cf, Strain CCMP1620" /LENGTH=306 /DNA_ID=CAMNT_0006966953 /DNA_START=35 /DNA_END=955 /DNA_ORIENTATION=+